LRIKPHGFLDKVLDLTTTQMVQIVQILLLSATLITLGVAVLLEIIGICPVRLVRKLCDWVLDLNDRINFF